MVSKTAMSSISMHKIKKDRKKKAPSNTPQNTKKHPSTRYL
uniref:Uncharacterized protein n=1 Tax=Arundo donax TaxID=35708 RepID=A0A0A9BYR5_ARUDO